MSGTSTCPVRIWLVQVELNLYFDTVVRSTQNGKIWMVKCNSVDT